MVINRSVEGRVLRDRRYAGRRIGAALVALQFAASVVGWTGGVAVGATVEKQQVLPQPFVVQDAPERENEAEARRQEKVHSVERAEDVAYRMTVDRERGQTDRWVIGTAIVTAVILVVQGFAFFIQAREMRRSVREMRLATGVAQSAAQSAKNSAEAAVGANRLTREAFLAEHRPWVKFTITPVLLNLRSGELELRLSFDATNIGTALALNFNFDARVIPHVLSAWKTDEGEIEHQRMVAEETNVGFELERFTEEVAEGGKSRAISGPLLFPTDNINDEFTIDRSDEAFSIGISRRGYSGQLLLLAGVRYMSAVDHSWHYTTLAFALCSSSRRIECVERGTFLAGLSDLVIRQHPLADSYAT